MLTDVIDQLDLDMDYKQLKNMITVANQDDTRILQLSVEYSDAKQAKEIVDKLSEVASEYIGDKMEVTPPKIIEKGEVPTSIEYRRGEDGSDGCAGRYDPVRRCDCYPHDHGRYD